MASRRVIFYRLYIVFNIALIWVAFSLIFLYNIVEVNKEVLESRSLSIYALAFACIGFIVAGAEAFFLKKIFRRFPLWLSSILRMTVTFLLFLLVSVLFLLAYYIISYEGTLNFFQWEKEFFQNVIMTYSFMMFMIDLGILAFISILILEISDKYGPGGVRNLILGRYNKPRKENRIFLFLDLNNSTTIAERIGHEKYFNMLHDFFADITEPILANAAHIYQYVGDEVVLTWPNTIENKEHCIRFIKDAIDALAKKAGYYDREYGCHPTFKAGVHAGDVTVGYIGIIKKDLVFSGDTLNTTARIRSKCHDVGEEFVMSVDFFEGFENKNNHDIREIGEMEFKGRKEKSKLFALRFEEEPGAVNN